MRLKKLVGILMLPALAKAAPGELAQAPVTQAVGVKPNIQIILDDSGSMMFDDTLNKGVETHGWEPTESANGYNYAYYWSSKSKEWKVRSHNVRERTTCLGFNVQAYNPDAVYKPWPGFKDIKESEWSKLNSLFYRRWDDANNNGEYDAWECGENGNAGKNYRVYFKNMSAEQKQNYANWFYYYRTRMGVARHALLNLVRNSSDRIGFNTINNKVTVPVADMDEEHSALLQKKISQEYNDKIGTPLRRALKRTGEYFKGSNSPILSAEEGGMCQQNYAILISDGYWNGASPYVGDVDQDGQPDTLADVAMKYYDTDLKSGLENRVPIVPGVDENNRQHLVTYTVAFGVNGTLEGAPEHYESIGEEFPGWPKVKKDTPTTIDDMLHAAYNSKGKFLSARNPQSLIQSLADISSDISSRAASTGSLGVSATDTSAGNFVIQTRYDPATWSGDIMLRPVGGDSIEEADWRLNKRLALQGASNRNIYTINGQTGTALFFDRSSYASLSATQQADMTALYSSKAAGNQTQQAGDLIDYLRGDASQDGKRYRNRRGNILGDIVSSSPVVATAPDSSPLGKGVDGAAQYAGFSEEQAGRGKVIYVGANDGMLHAIDHDSGDELFAFIPHGAFAGKGSGFGLHQLAKKDYLHRYYVDASPTVRDAYVNLDAGGKRWRTLLAGGMGAGGRSIYLLDVTDPDDFDTPEKVVKWEFTHNNLGYTFSEVQIARLKNGKWYAIFGNGYNASGDGQAKLFLVNLEDSTDYHEIDTGVGHADGGTCEDVSSDCNGLSSPELADLNGDGIVDWIYAGDLHGNVWAFDLQGDDDVEDISIIRLFTSCATPLEGGQSCTKDNRQPITTKVALARNPRLAGSVATPNINVYWGTGQLLARGDVENKTLQSFYSVLHTGNESGTASSAYYHDALAKRSYVTWVGKDGLADVRSVEPGTDVNYKGVDGPRQYGWYIELPDSGERLVNTPGVVGDVVAFNTTVPGIGGLCDVASNGWINALSLADGLAPDRNPGNNPDRIGNEQVFDVNQDGDFGADDMIDDSVVLSIRMPGEPTSPSFIGDTQYVGLANSGEENGGMEILTMQLSDGSAVGRASWYQVR